MAKYILKRLAYMVVVFFILSILLFGLFKMVPGDPARMLVEGQKMSVSPEKLLFLNVSIENEIPPVIICARNKVL